MTLQDALEYKEIYLSDFKQQLEEKVKSIKRGYSRDNLNEKQLHFLQQDEAFCKSAETVVNALLHQIDFLVNQMQLDRDMMKSLSVEVTQTQESLINTMLENTRLKDELGKLDFKFGEAC